MHRTLSAAGAFWLAAFTYFIWGFTFLASRIAQDYGTPFVLLFWRFALAFLVLNLLRLTGRFPVRFRSRKLWPVLLAGLFEPVLYFPCTSRSAGSAPRPRPPSSSASGACSASPRRHCRTLPKRPSRCPRREQAGRLPHFQSSMLLHYLSSENC